jgi:hypothetical protein
MVFGVVKRGPPWYWIALDVGAKEDVFTPCEGGARAKTNTRGKSRDFLSMMAISNLKCLRVND